MLALFNTCFTCVSITQLCYLYLQDSFATFAARMRVRSKQLQFQTSVLLHTRALSYDLGVHTLQVG